MSLIFPFLLCVLICWLIKTEISQQLLNEIIHRHGFQTMYPNDFRVPLTFFSWQHHDVKI